MKPSLIVYGPQRCGKTRNAEKLCQHFGLTRVIELDEVQRGFVAPPEGALLLTYKDPSSGLSRHGLTMMPFDAAITSLKRGGA